MVSITNLDRLDTLSGVGAVNANFAALKAAVEALQTNKLPTDLDANSKRIFNLAPAVSPNSPVTLSQLDGLTVDPTEIDDLLASIALLTSQLSNANSDIDSLTAQLAAALARIDALEDAIDGGITPPLPTNSYVVSGYVVDGYVV